MAHQVLFLLSLLPSLRLLLIFVLTFLIVKFILTRKATANLPPGPWGVPLLGASFRLGVDPVKSLLKLSQTYGKVFSLYIGQRLTVVITDPAVVRQAYGKMAAYTSAREISTLDWLDTSGSLVFGSGSHVKPLRRFLLRTLRDFGLGKSKVEALITTEAHYLCGVLEREKGRVFDPRLALQKAVSNIMCALCFGRRFAYESSTLTRLVHGLQAVSHISGLSITREIPLLFLAPRFKDFREGGLMYRQVLDQLVEDHKATFDPQHPRDVTDKLLQQMMNKEDSVLSFGEDRVYRTLMDMFGAGADTTSATLQFAVWHMATNPKVQKRVHSEILAVVGTGRDTAWADRHRLPYTWACVNETLRRTHPAPLGLLHRAEETFELAGCTIPEGAEIMTPLGAMFLAPEVWPEPEEFNPERFLSEDGKTGSVSDGFMPFSTGSRMCIGEGLARMELFMMLATLVQRFTFDLPLEVPQSCQARHGFFFRYPSQMQLRATPNY